MPHYYIVGQTHPKVVEREGESYRNELRELVSRWNLEECIKFDSRYLDTEDLFEIAHLADIVLLPYDSVEQVTSGVLAEAVTAGKPVISTGFPHAVELLSSGAGIIVERQSPDAIASAIRQLVTDANLLAQLTAEAKRIGPDQLWSAVADKYLDLVFDVSHERQLRGVSA
jgi:glycosyltransferase involved in cell wall biosynthesis